MNASATTRRYSRIRVWRCGVGFVENNIRVLPSVDSVHKAATIGAFDQLKQLIDSSSDELHGKRMLEWEDGYGRTPLIMAVKRGHLECTRILLQAGANVHHVSLEREGGTALHTAFYENRSKQFISLLLANRAEPFLENKGGETAWDICRQQKRKECKELAKMAIFDDCFDVKESASFTSRSLYRGLHLKVFPCYRISSQGNRKIELSGFRFCLYKKKATNVIYDVDMDGCEARIVSKNNHPSLILINCPVYCIEEWTDKGSKDCQTGHSEELCLQGSLSSCLRFVDIIRSPQKLRSDEDDSLICTENTLHLLNSSCVANTLVMDEQHCTTSDVIEASNRYSNLNLDIDSTEFPLWVFRLGLCTNTLKSKVPICQDKTHPGHHGSTKNRRKNSTVQTARSSYSDSAVSKCVICLEGQRTAGFVHNGSIHVCACEECASHFLQGEDQCPLCRQTIEHIVKRIYS